MVRGEEILSASWKVPQQPEPIEAEVNDGSGSPDSVLSMRFIKKESLKANWVWVLK